MSKSLGNGIDPQEVSKKLGAEIIRLWVRQHRLLGRLRWRRQDPRARGRRLPPHPQHAALPARQHQRLRSAARRGAAVEQWLEIDRYALARRAQVCRRDVLAHYEVYEFHPVVAKLQVFCSEDLGAFYLDMLKDRLYTTRAGLAARRSAQTALWHITHSDAALDGAVPSLHGRRGVEGLRQHDGGTIFTETYATLPRVRTSRAARQVDAHPRDARRRATRRSRRCATPARSARRCRPTSTIRVAGRRVRAARSRWATTCGSCSSRRSAASYRCPARPMQTISVTRIDRREVRALLALARRRRRDAAAPDALRPLRHATSSAPASPGHLPDERALRRPGAAAHAAVAGAGAAHYFPRPAHQDVDPAHIPARRRAAGHRLLQHRAGPQHGRGVLVPGRRGGLAALVLHRARPRRIGLSSSICSRATGSSGCSRSRWR